MAKDTKKIKKEAMDESSRPLRKKGNILKKLFLLIILILALTIGFLYVQQLYLDLEAIAIINAAQTADSAASSQNLEGSQPATLEIKATSTQMGTILTPTETLDPDMAHTATVAAQLTQVAEFQLTVTPTP
jgi:cell division septal protein FtsQ